MTDERKKLTIYLHPDQEADRVSLDIIESVPRNERGDLFRKSLISGLALHQLDSRLPGLIAVLLNQDFSADQLVSLLSQTTGWKPSQADIRVVLAELGAGLSGPAVQHELPDDDEQRRMDEARKKMKNFI
ncbi:MULTISPECIES: plasmid partitioning/stability family protein [Enterobacteriaceae]|uniref:plasmid partitioning/stability family protein n=1 Tax=Enterobacteriaceae TaxID=543 RepID=UPI000DCB5A32|nr:MULTISPECIES: plasmid partitioning/stability family protein [Enterobacteriaceae]QCZ30310.1 plasmid stability protein [Leclercia adecarboxylata]QXB24176.1 plasmid partitioning/stability family protein [Lelliottia amnigena]RAY64660.1 plasmid stability protein [Enterobacter kobei]HED2829241.1 plasmid partitioning/stability family protein [Enterobacter kobei]HEG2118928.1 plasmid partitioning/stability family protein [Enterobacter kobei]